MGDDTLFTLAEAYFDGNLTDEQADRLTCLLHQSKEHREQFLHELETCNLLSQVGLICHDDEEFERAFWERVQAEENGGDFAETFEARRVQATEETLWQSPQLDFDEPDHDVHQIKQYAEQQLQQFLLEQEQLQRASQRHPSHRPADPWVDISLVGQKLNRALVGAYRSVVVGALLLTLGLTAYVTIQYTRSHSQIPVVATLGNSVHAQWLVAPTEPRLRPGWLTLEQGAAQIEFARGAQVIFQAPCRFKLESANAMFLAEGSASAHVPESATGFAITTSTSRVVDFGTDFGVHTRENGNTETHVYDGRVSLESHLATGSAHTPKLLTQGHAAVVDTSGQIREIPCRPQQIIRTLPEASQFGVPGKRLNLADVVGGGNGFGTGYTNSAIDALTGQFILEFYTMGWADRLVEARPTDLCHYEPVPTHEYVDGVFSPTANPAPITVSSAGHTLTLSPPVSATPHKACPGIGNWSSKECPAWEGYDVVLDGRTYGSPLHPVILMRVNKGITFDLDAIRANMPETKIDRFTSLCGVSAADRKTTRNAQASFYVLVDGVTRFSRTAVSSSSPGIPVDLELKDTERFLTLIAVFTEITPEKPHRAMFAEAALQLARMPDEQQRPGDSQTFNPRIPVDFGKEE